MVSFIDQQDAMASVRYIVRDVDEAIAFYRDRLGFEVAMHPAPTFAILAREDLRLMLSSPSSQGGGGQDVGGRTPEPGGWNRISLPVEDLEREVERLRAAGTRFLGDIVRGVGGDQALAEDPSGNLVELFQFHPRG
jgi:catechol 2,3-dioxygenase-like lactoylglutathione lyase family enzyme